MLTEKKISALAIIGAWTKINFSPFLSEKVFPKKASHPTLWHLTIYLFTVLSS